MRILIVSAVPLLGQGLEAWLRRQRGLDVLGYERDAGRVSERIEQLEPDVVIIDESTWLDGPATALMRFLACRPGAKIIGVDLRNNSIRILSSEDRTIDLIGQLFGAITGRTPASEPAEQCSEG